jgi:hypothetical protein
MSPEELHAEASSMGTKRALQRRAETGAKPRTWLAPGLKMGELLSVVAPALVADDEFVGAPLWGVRLAAAGTLLAAYPRYYKETPEKVNELLETMIPDRAYDRERMKAEAVFAALRSEWDSGQGVRWSKLKGLFVRPYPGHMIAPWENAEKIQGSRPAPIAPDRAPVMQLPNGGVALERKSAPPLMLELGEPEDDLSIEVDVNAVQAW